MPTCDHGNKGWCHWCDGPRRKPDMVKVANALGAERPEKPARDDEHRKIIQDFLAWAMLSRTRPVMLYDHGSGHSLEPQDIRALLEEYLSTN